MNDTTAEQVRATVDETYRTESRRVFATLVRLIGDMDLAEEAMHEAFTAAVELWQRDGIPANPRAWLVASGRNKAIDVIRRRARHDAALHEVWPIDWKPTPLSTPRKPASLLMMIAYV